jgi:hypothetical protein
MRMVTYVGVYVVAYVGHRRTQISADTLAVAKYAVARPYYTPQKVITLYFPISVWRAVFAFVGDVLTTREKILNCTYPCILRFTSH